MGVIWGYMGLYEVIWGYIRLYKHVVIIKHSDVIHKYEGVFLIGKVGQDRWPPILYIIYRYSMGLISIFPTNNSHSMWNQLCCACPTAVVPKSGKGQMIPSSKVGQSCTDRLHGSLSLRLVWTPIAQYQPVEWKRMLKDHLICERGPTRRSPVALNFPLLADSALCGAEPLLRLEGKGAHAYLPVQSMLESKDLHRIHRRGWIYRSDPQWIHSSGSFEECHLAFVVHFHLPLRWESGVHLINPVFFASAASCFPSSQGGRPGPTSKFWPHGATRKGQLLGPASKTGGMLYFRPGGLRDSLLHWPGFFHVFFISWRHVATVGSSLKIKTHEFLVIWGIWHYFGTIILMGSMLPYIDGSYGLWFWYLIHPDSQGIMSCAVEPVMLWPQEASWATSSNSGFAGHPFVAWPKKGAAPGMVPESELTSGWLPSLRNVFVVKNVGKNAETWKSKLATFWPVPMSFQSHSISILVGETSILGAEPRFLPAQPHFFHDGWKPFGCFGKPGCPFSPSKGSGISPMQKNNYFHIIIIHICIIWSYFIIYIYIWIYIYIYYI